MFYLRGPVVELAYTTDLKSVARMGLRVRVPPGLPLYFGLLAQLVRAPRS